MKNGIFLKVLEKFRGRYEFECKKGSYFEINKGQVHSIENTGKKNLK